MLMMRGRAWGRARIIEASFLLCDRGEHRQHQRPLGGGGGLGRQDFERLCHNMALDVPPPRTPRARTRAPVPTRARARAVLWLLLRLLWLLRPGHARLWATAPLDTWQKNHQPPTTTGKDRRPPDPKP